MNNIVRLQQKILCLIQEAKNFGSATPANAYFIGDFDPEHMLAVIDLCDVVYSFSPSETNRGAMEEIARVNPKLVVLQKMERKEVQFVVIDAHINNKQFGSELAILKAMLSDLKKTLPFLFVRSEDADQSMLVSVYLDAELGHDSYFFQQYSGNELKQDNVEAIWTFSLSRALQIEGFGYDTCLVTGHPKAPRQVAPEYVILEPTHN